MSDDRRLAAEAKRNLRTAERERRHQNARIARETRRIVHDAQRRPGPPEAVRPAGATGSRPRVNVFGVVLALIFLAVASAGFTSDPWWLFGMAAKWLVAGAVALIGLTFLLSALPRRRSGRS